jgi:hypothetical protein
MSVEGMRQVIGRMISDPAYNAAVNSDPQGTLGKSGFDLTPEEIGALGKITPDELNSGLSQLNQIADGGWGLGVVSGKKAMPDAQRVATGVSIEPGKAVAE